ncbi:hypothetical protein [Aureimonas pseudogalii]|uniref:Uncharacterized protein n=1 Tax=Aureimonas pseudogalii TaxID=1744844 RepID=A0A7W6H834_9HYPH|nr:hypothetical protein [Aureimonas pseudogalii]MBB4000151.1 hypothetical protein [Aureimonas pseudogalii]
MTMEKVIGPPPAADELAAAPIVHLWELRPMRYEEFFGRHQLFGFMIGHPKFEDMAFANSSPVMEIDTASPPTWARCDSRLYRLGQSKADYSKGLER